MTKWTSEQLRGIEFDELHRVPIEGTRVEFMSDPQNRLEYLNTLRIKVPEMKAEVLQLIVQQNTFDLLWYANWTEYCRNRQMTNIPTSDIAGQLRYIRTLLVSEPIRSGRPRCTVTAFRAILDAVSLLWTSITELRLLDTVAGPNASMHDKRVEAANLMVLLQLGETEVGYAENAWGRLERIVSPFDDTLMIPKFGGRIADLRTAFDKITKCLEENIDVAIHGAANLNLELGFTADGPSIEPDSENNLGSIYFIEMNRLAQAIRPIRLESFLGDFGTAFGIAPGAVLGPSDNSIVRTRPFGIVNDSCVAILDPYHMSFAPKYVIPSLFVGSQQLLRLYRRRAQVLEEDGISQLNQMFVPQAKYNNVFVLHSDHRLREHDALFVRQGTGIVIECKAKPFRSFVRTDANVKKAMSDFSESIQEGYSQGARLARLLKEGPVELRDHRGNVTGSVGPLSKVYVVVVLDSSAKSLATDLSPWLEVDDDVGFPWVIDIDVLRVIGTKLTGFKSLRRYLNWRLPLHGRVENEDEACFAGFFLQHGAQSFPADAQIALDPTYSDIFDEEYFRQLGFDPPRVQFDLKPAFSTMTRNGNVAEIGVGHLQKNIK